MNDTRQAGMLGFAKDLPNICSLIGLLCTVLGIYFAIEGNFLASIIGVLWAVLFDWLDGIVARNMKGRTKEQGVLGAQLDSMIDIVSFSMLPAILLLSYGNYSFWFIPGAFIIIATGAIRLSYFNIYGLVDSKTYRGMPLDNNVLILAFVFLFEILFSQAIFAIIIYALLMILSALNLASIRTPKFDGNWVYALVAYVIIMTVVFLQVIYCGV